MKNKVYVIVCDEYFKNNEGQSNVGVYANREDALKEFKEIKEDFISEHPDYFENCDDYEVTESECHYYWQDIYMGYYFDLWIEEHFVK